LQTLHTANVAPCHSDLTYAPVYYDIHNNTNLITVPCWEFDVTLLF